MGWGVAARRTPAAHALQVGSQVKGGFRRLLVVGLRHGALASQQKRADHGLMAGVLVLKLVGRGLTGGQGAAAFDLLDKKLHAAAADLIARRGAGGERNAAAPRQRIAVAARDRYVAGNAKPRI